MTAPAPMPPRLRAWLRRGEDAALAVECPHCHAQPHKPCTTPSKRHRLDQPHPSRTTQEIATHGR